MTTPEFEQAAKAFAEEWNDGQSTIEVHTSGSTGKPKLMRVGKEQMRNSAEMTLDFLNLKEGDTALLCMPVDYIAGKMMVVRSIVGRLRLVCVAPQRNPLREVNEDIDFGAMTPMQIYNTLQSTEETEKLKRIKNLIIGGGAIDDNTAAILRDFPSNVWSTYGMTETLSHIAMRRMSGPEANEMYTPLRGVSISLSERGTLRIEAPHLCDGTLETNDIAEIDSYGRFRIIGRTDNTINTGGIKVQIEEVESKLKPWLSKPFAITCAPDQQFGEAIVLLTEDTDTQTISNICQRELPKYWQPKHIIVCSPVPLTETNKPDRAKAKSIATDKTKK